MSLPLVFQAAVRDGIDEAYRWDESQRTGLAEASWMRSGRSSTGCGCDPELHATFYLNVRHGRQERFPTGVLPVEPGRIAGLAVSTAVQSRTWRPGS